jgi:hypothetical protein
MLWAAATTGKEHSKYHLPESFAPKDLIDFHDVLSAIDVLSLSVNDILAFLSAEFHIFIRQHIL